MRSAGGHGIFHAVGVQLGVSDLEVDHGVDLHGDVILGDDGLGGEVHHLLLQGHVLDDALNEGDLEVETHTPHGLEGAQPLNDVGTGLLYHPDIYGNDHQDQDDADNGDDEL